MGVEALRSVCAGGKTKAEEEEEMPKLNIAKEPECARLTAEVLLMGAAQHPHFKGCF